MTGDKAAAAIAGGAACGPPTGASRLTPAGVIATQALATWAGGCFQVSFCDGCFVAHRGATLLAGHAVCVVDQESGLHHIPASGACMPRAYFRSVTGIIRPPMRFHSKALCSVSPHGAGDWLRRSLFEFEGPEMPCGRPTSRCESCALTGVQSPFQSRQGRSEKRCHGCAPCRRTGSIALGPCRLRRRSSAGAVTRSSPCSEGRGWRRAVSP